MGKEKQNRAGLTIDDLRKNGWIAYEYIRGSHLYGLNNENSDEDHGGVYVCPRDMVMGLRDGYVPQVSDEKGDTVFYEIGRWVELLMNANPTALESLYVPKRCVIRKPRPSVQEVLKHRDMFLTKQCFRTLLGYATSQIQKARGLNKMIVNPVETRKTILDFCYVPSGQGSKPVAEWLAERGLKQKYCGLVDLPNMHDAYGLYYDWGTHLICEFGADLKYKTNLTEVMSNLTGESEEAFYHSLTTLANPVNGRRRSAWLLMNEGLVNPYGFCGIMNENSDSNDVRVCNVPEGIKPLTVMSYNRSGYEAHCRDYANYQTWRRNRNEDRYRSNLGKNYDSKNMMHCMRLTVMGRELAEGKGFNVDRTDIDRDFLLKIRNHGFEYDEILGMAEKEMERLKILEPQSTLPDGVDFTEANELLIRVREIAYCL